jgi:hypothetical protein
LLSTNDSTKQKLRTLTTRCYCQPIVHLAEDRGAEKTWSLTEYTRNNQRHPLHSPLTTHAAHLYIPPLRGAGVKPQTPMGQGRRLASLASGLGRCGSSALSPKCSLSKRQFPRGSGHPLSAAQKGLLSTNNREILFLSRVANSALSAGFPS